MLEEHPDPLAHAVELRVAEPGDVLARDAHGARVGTGEPADEPEKRALPGPASTEDHRDLPGHEAAAEAPEDGTPAQGQVHPVQGNPELLHRLRVVLHGPPPGESSGGY